MSDVQTAEPAGMGDNHPPPAASPAAETHDDTPLDPHVFIEGVAGEMGWSPKEKWKGDPEKWRPAVDFLKATPKVVKSAKEQLERANRVATESMDRIRREATEDAERRIAEAAEAGDAVAAKEATEDLKRAQAKPDPVVEDFAKRNPWYMTDHSATQVAIAAAQKVADSGGTVAAQVEAGEKEVRKRFPELFDDEEPDPAPRRQPPAVEGGQRAASPGAPRKKGWAELPATIRQAITPKQLKSWGLTQDQYADSYYKENA